VARRGHRLFAFCFAHLAPRAERRDGALDHRRELLASARGRVLEIGAGTGLNLPHYPEAVSEVVATEPDPHMRKRLVKAVAFASRPVEVVDAVAERLPFADGAFDTAVASLVLCSVDDPVASLLELRRVLRPDGRLLVYEHVRAEDPRLAARQDLAERPWGWLGAGCHPNRPTAAIVESAGFVWDGFRRFEMPGLWLASPHVLGAARPAA
jgi:SAM-dependent methyltransferase